MQQYHHNIGKEIDFCYGHRVHNQSLIEGFAEDTCLKCRHLHGHQGKLIINLSSDNLKNGMITDFKHLHFMKRFVDNYIDHKMILDINDPSLPYLFPNLILKKENDLEELIPSFNSSVGLIKLTEGKMLVPKLHENLSIPLREVYEGLVFVDFVPTSENLSVWLAKIAQQGMSHIDVTVSNVVFKETPKTYASYTFKNDNN